MPEPIVVTPGQSEAPPLERAAQARRIAAQLDRDAIEEACDGRLATADLLHEEAIEMYVEARALEGVGI